MLTTKGTKGTKKGHGGHVILRPQSGEAAAGQKDPFEVWTILSKAHLGRNPPR